MIIFYEKPEASEGEAMDMERRTDGPQLVDLNDVKCVVYEAVQPYTELLLEHHFKYPCNGHHEAQKIAQAVVDALVGNRVALDEAKAQVLLFMDERGPQTSDG